MQRRASLLLVLLGVLVLFYASVTRKSVPLITAEQQTQTRTLNQLDEQVLGKVGPAKEADGVEDEADGREQDSSEH
jgi:hypothetical protein